MGILHDDGGCCANSERLTMDTKCTMMGLTFLAHLHFACMLIGITTARVLSRGGAATQLMQFTS